MKKIKTLVRKHRLIIVVFAIIVLVIGINIGFTAYYVNRQNNKLSDLYVPKISYDLVRALNQLSVPLVVSPTNGELYIPEAHLVLPLPPKNLTHFGYSYASLPFPPGTEIEINSLTELEEAESAILNSASLQGVYNSVPKAQSCARGVQIYYQSQPESGQKPFYTKVLTDKRTLYFYQDNLCEDSSFTDYIEQINSY
ncbi:MAG TPA: hypothetical protein VMR08_03390 [Patescibacteria group bacterium]|nr:hypothetical protein [Patescibacteria group bacterium]